MDRIDIPDLQQWVDQFRLDRAPGIIDDRRDLVDRDVLCYYQDATDPTVWHESKLKIDDDVRVGGEVDPITQELTGGMLVRVVGAATGRGWFAGASYMMPEDTAPTLGVFPLVQVTDRAPADPNEPGPHFPIIPPPVSP